MGRASVGLLAGGCVMQEYYHGEGVAGDKVEVWRKKARIAKRKLSPGLRHSFGIVKPVREETEIHVSGTSEMEEWCEDKGRESCGIRILTMSSR